MKILAPISVGELYDKLSILSIKIEKLDDQEQINNVAKEYRELAEVANQFSSIPDEYTDLKIINMRLWDAENELRKLGKDFIKEYVKFAKVAYDVYTLNDQRAKLKYLINTKHNSEIIEEKYFKI